MNELSTERAVYRDFLLIGLLYFVRSTSCEHQRNCNRNEERKHIKRSRDELEDRDVVIVQFLEQTRISQSAFLVTSGRFSELLNFERP